MASIETFADRKFMFLLYPDDSTHVDALEIIKRSFDYAVVLHDKDVNEDGELKKPHWHVVVTVGSNKRWNSAIAKELGIEMNYIQKIKSMDRALEYLIHFNDIDKFQYSIDTVKGSLKNRLLASINSSDKTEGEKIVQLINIIENEPNTVSYTWLSKQCAMNGYWDVFRRSGVLFIKIIDEHNRAVSYGKTANKPMDDIDFNVVEKQDNPFENDEYGIYKRGTIKKNDEVEI